MSKTYLRTTQSRRNERHADGAMNQKSQSALEFMIIVAMGMVLIAIGSFFGSDYILSYSDSINGINANQMVTNVVSAANLVYSQGVGAQTKIVVTVPHSIVLNRTYMSGNEINLRLSSAAGPTDVFQNAAVNLTGSIPVVEGMLTLYVKMELQRKAVVFIDAPVSYILIGLYNNSGRTQPSMNFTSGQTVYYSVRLYDFNDTLVNSDIIVNVYQTNESQYGSTITTNTTGGYYNGSFVAGAGSNGKWLISVVEQDFDILGTVLFNKN